MPGTTTSMRPGSTYEWERFHSPRPAGNDIRSGVLAPCFTKE
ncbi:hypothetical protein D187_000256 [Cystobacter fuscus DSM 2262]|uniref:Uncharacterized protein n=1 Tax=Cystobacter fuscus (strain ATCC 25194 / DSM 2262 / NBRC 100088 / M29) TaxID=1242864 RepID=S9QU20_CYSF2|nr:hypothetical protein D187_000256 [Cystobacter fuscus DSM 2262]